MSASHPANLLLLDEPTNHLDIPAREALEAFLRESVATVLVVSHDRRLLEGVCTQLWVVDRQAGKGIALVARFDGGYREWRSSVADGWTVETAGDSQTRLSQRGSRRASTAPTGAGRP